MPTYDYKCLDCGHSFEHFQRISDEALTSCPECSGNIKRLIGAGLAPILRGTGFYQTDYKNVSKKSENKAQITKTEGEKKSG